jgi:hypothetical protein
MLFLFFFGPHLESKWGSREFIRYYLVCGLGGVALSFLFVSYSIIGASAAVYGVMLAFAMAWPNAPIYVWGIFPVKAKWLVGFFVLITFLNAFGGAGGGVAHFAHLGGFAAGFLYLKTDWRASQAMQSMGKAARSRRFAIVPREEREAATSGRRRSDDTVRRGRWTPSTESWTRSRRRGWGPSPNKKGSFSTRYRRSTARTERPRRIPVRPPLVRPSSSGRDGPFRLQSQTPGKNDTVQIG